MPPHALVPCTKICTKTGIRPISWDHHAINKNNALEAEVRRARVWVAETKGLQSSPVCAPEVSQKWPNFKELAAKCQEVRKRFGSKTYQDLYQVQMIEVAKGAR